MFATLQFLLVITTMKMAGIYRFDLYGGSCGGNGGRAAWSVPGSGRQFLNPAPRPGLAGADYEYTCSQSLSGKFGFCASVTMQSDMCDLWNVTLIQYYEISLMY